MAAAVGLAAGGFIYAIAYVVEWRYGPPPMVSFDEAPAAEPLVLQTRVRLPSACALASDIITSAMTSSRSRIPYSGKDFPSLLSRYLFAPLASTPAHAPNPNAPITVVVSGKKPATNPSAP